MLVRKILIIGACDSELILSRFKPEEVSVIGKDEDVWQFWKLEGVEFAAKTDGVKAAVVIYNEVGKLIFERLIFRGIHIILILPEKPKINLSLIRKLTEKGAKGIFCKDFTENPLMIEEFYRQVSKLAV